MKALLLLSLLFTSSAVMAKEGKKTIVPGTSCDVNISLEDPAPKEKLAFWGKILKVTEKDGLPGGQEIIFEPKNAHIGPKYKQVKIFMKRSPCWMSVKAGEYYSVVIDEKGMGTFYAIATDSSKGSPKGYPEFAIEFNACEGFDSDFGMASADLFAMASPIEVKRDEKAGIEIVTFKAKRVWNGPEVGTFKFIQKTGETCSEDFSKGRQYDLILNKVNDKYYNLALCCGGVLTIHDDDYEKSVSARRAELKKKLSGKD